jgi:hypothetical protein
VQTLFTTKPVSVFDGFLIITIGVAAMVIIEVEKQVMGWLGILKICAGDPDWVHDAARATIQRDRISVSRVRSVTIRRSSAKLMVAQSRAGASSARARQN